MSIISGNNYSYTGDDINNSTGSIIRRTPTANSTDTLPTASNMILSFVGTQDELNNGVSCHTTIYNDSSFNIINSPNTGMSFVNSTSDTIFPQTAKTYTLIQTSATSVSVYIIGSNPVTMSPTTTGISLNDSNILVGNSSNVAIGTKMTGDALISNTGSLEIQRIPEAVQASFSTLGSVAYSISSGYTSIDNVQSSAMSWTPSSPLNSANFRSICFGNNIFVAIASNGTTTTQIYTSPDGITWTARTSPNAQAWQSVCYAENIGFFVAVANNGAVAAQIMTSPNGITWSAATSSSATTWTSVCRSSNLSGMTSGNLYVAVAAVATTTCVMSSITGTGTWTARTGIAATGGGWRSICWADGIGLGTISTNSTYGLFVAVSNSTNAAACVMTSPNGITWTARTASSATSWNSVCWSETIELLVAVAGNGTVNCVMTSPNGTTWTARTGIAGTWNSVTWSPSLNMFVAVGNAGAIMHSLNGINWTSVTPVNSNNLSAVCWGNSILNRFVAVSNTAAAGNSIYSDGVLSQYNGEYIIGTKGASNVTIQGKNVIVFPVPYYYGESTVARSIATANNYVTDITIRNVPSGIYRVNIFMQASLRTAAAAADGMAIFGSVSSGPIFVLQQITTYNYAGNSTAGGPSYFDFVINTTTDAGVQDISYAITSSTAAAFFTAGFLRTMFLTRIG